MDKLTLLGLVVAVVAIFGGQILEGGSIDALLNGSAFVIVVGGSAGAVMVQSHAKTFMTAIRILKWTIVPPILSVAEGISQISVWSNLARREGLLGLEKSIDNDLDPFVLKGLNMLVDGSDSKSIREALFVEMDVKDGELLNAAKIYESMGGYSPTLGIVGAVLGLIHVMGNLGDPELLGAGIATAFVATIYGVGFANLLFIPIYHKLRAVIAKQSQYKEMLVEGLASIADGENPRVIEGKLNGFLVS